ncbi:MAG TPA: carbohydrate ABC transporter permease [Candidatus Limiplasma sp.]|nr:carbohydrate ABC transporter permease [Candidatus Limiplasma sp.]
MSIRIKRRLAHFPIFLLLLIIALIVLLPVVWMMISSFKPAKEIISYPPTFFAKTFSLENYQRLAKRLKVFVYIKNSCIYATLTTIPSVFICSLAGYAFARFQFKGRNVLFLMVLATMMIPFQVIMIPLFLVVKTMGMYDSYAGLVLPKLAVAISIFMMRSAFVALPKELEEAGRIDGVGEFGLYWKIMMPQVMPTMITMLILGVNAAWNDLMWPLLVTSSTKMRTLANGLALFIGSDTSEYGPAFAGALYSILPMLVLYIIGQKYFVEGTVTSGLKG